MEKTLWEENKELERLKEQDQLKLEDDDEDSKAKKQKAREALNWEFMQYSTTILY